MKNAAHRKSQTEDLGAGDAVDHAQLFPLFKTMMPYQAQILARMMQNDYIARIADTGIAPAQAYLLGELWFDEPLSQVELARRLDIGKATIGQTLNRLERAGVIERRRVASDRRVIMIHLTEKGRSLREPLAAATELQMNALKKIIGEAELAQLTELLIRATTKLRAALPKEIVQE
ncbi:MAG: MarR family transcriptional regulator [Caulobacterales bacterium]